MLIGKALKILIVFLLFLAIIPYPITNSVTGGKYYTPIIARRYVDGQLSGEVSYTDTTYSSFTRVYIFGGHDYWIDQIRIRPYADSEPSVSIGSSQLAITYPWFTGEVNPTSVNIVLNQSHTSENVSFNVNITNIGGSSGWVLTELIDHNNMVRDSVNITLQVNQSQIVTLSTTVDLNDRGDWTWYIVGMNDTTTFFNQSITVSIHYQTSYTYTYNLEFSSSQSLSPVNAIRYNYLVNPTSNMLYNDVEANRYNYVFDPVSTMLSNSVGSNKHSRIWGSQYSLAIQTNTTGKWDTVYFEHGGTVYILTIEFYYNITTPFPDLPDAHIVIRDSDTGEVLTNIYIPNGNTSITLYADKYYQLTIPKSGNTLHGYYFKLSKYVINGVENPEAILLSRNSVLKIYYDIVNESSSGSPVALEVTTKIITIGSSVGVYAFNTLIYGGDVFYNYQKIINGLIQNKTITNNWVSFGSSYDSVVLQYYSSVSTPVHGAGFYEGGNYVVVGYYLNATTTNTHILGGRFLVDSNGGLQNIIYTYQEAIMENYQSYEHYGKIIFYKGNVATMIYANGQWYRIGTNMNTTAVSYAVFIGSYHPSYALLMRGDYIVFKGSGLEAVEITGVDAGGNNVNIAVADNSPEDADPTNDVIMIQELPVLYPINATIKLYYEKTEPTNISYGLPPIIGGSWINASWNNISVTLSNSSLVNPIIGLLNNDYGGIILGLLPLLLLLYPNRKYGALMGLFAVGIAGFINIVAIQNGYNTVIPPEALVLSAIILILGLLYEVK